MKYSIIYLAIAITGIPLWSHEQAMVIKPVIDLFFSADLPRYCPASFGNNRNTCPRGLQLLMHDIVTVHEKKGDAWYVEVPHAYYKDAHGAASNLYWTAADNLTLITKRPEHTVTLIYPYYEPTLGIQYSHGTRFAPTNQNVDEDAVEVYAYAPVEKKWTTITLPLSHCLLEKPSTSHEQRKLFIELLSKSIDYAHHHGGVIPYVWGGKSFTIAQPDDFFVHAQGIDRIKITNPVAGFDCSNMIMHYAQICGMPYSYKSSATLELYGTEKKLGDPIEEGDILWVPGHVMVIMKNKRELIEATGYKWLYGRMHRIKIKDRVLGAHTVEDILKIFNKKGSVKFLDKHRKPTTISSVKVFSLCPTKG